LGNDSTISLLQAATDEVLYLASYDPRWPEQFIREKNRLLQIFSSDMLEVEHIGSTSVPGMIAKPIIDIIVGLHSIRIADTLLPPLRQYGYATPTHCNDGLKDRRWLLRHAAGHRTHHLHLVILNSLGWERTLKFRDALRSDPEAARAYAEIKTRLLKENSLDRTKYIQAKSGFIEEVVSGRWRKP
jgi:GrpB-like predicted nucleotidyltransferase (UPF0157 family)